MFGSSKPQAKEVKQSEFEIEEAEDGEINLFQLRYGMPFSNVNMCLFKFQKVVL